MDANTDRSRLHPSRLYNSRLWAVLLIGGGLVFLAANLGWLGPFAAWLWALVFLAGGLAFIYVYRADRAQWWALIPGFGLLGLGAAALVGGDAAGPLFLGLAGAGFAAVYLSDNRGDPRRWWAVIPGGVLLTLALVASLDSAWAGFDAGWVFFLGLAATFGLLALLPEHRGRQRWAVFPALGAAALALVTFASSGVGGVVLPLLLVAVGAFLLWRRDRPPGDPPASKEA